MDDLNTASINDFLIDPRCEVRIYSNGTVHKVDGRIVAYTERGLLVEETDEEDTVFIPWSAVAYIRHREEKDNGPE